MDHSLRHAFGDGLQQQEGAKLGCHVTVRLRSGSKIKALSSLQLPV